MHESLPNISSKISSKQLIWFNRYNHLSFKVQFLKWTCSGTLNIHQLWIKLCTAFVSSSTVLLANVSTHSVFEQTVQNVHHLQQHTNEVCWQVASHSRWSTKQSSLFSLAICWSALVCISAFQHCTHKKSSARFRSVATRLYQWH